MPALRNAAALRAALDEKGFTPKRKEIPALLGLLVDDSKDVRRAIERALMFHAADAARDAMRLFADATPPLRARLLRVVGRVAASDAPGVDADALWAFVVEGTRDADPKTRRNAAIALGRSEGLAGAEAALLDAWDRESRVDHRRTVMTSLGKVGLYRARSLLRRVASSDVELQKAIEQAALMVERNVARERVTGVRADVAPPRPVEVELRCRPGLEALCAEELGELVDARVVGAGRVAATLRGPLSTLFRSRTAAEFSLVLPEVPVVDGDVVAAVRDSLTSPLAVATLEALSLHGVRYRLEWEDGGNRRAITWRCVSAVAERCPALVNDPRESPWEVRVRELPGAVQLLLTPRMIDDPRFRYRRATVPAASHPTVAAAIARVAGARPDDVVWDPFVGSGLELAERARLGPYERMEGRDLSEEALDAARQNLDGVSDVTLVRGDALGEPPRGVTLIVSNPPLGYRTAFGEAEDLLTEFTRRARQALKPGGRLVWVVPARSRVPEVAAEVGFQMTRRIGVDLGGLECLLLRLEAPGAQPTSRRATTKRRRSPAR